MTHHQEFLARWASETDPQPLILTGAATAVTSALEFIRPLFPATDVYDLKTEEKTIPIAAVRAMREAASQSAWSGRRLVIIFEAEKLGGAAVQALLKLLEEPTKSTRFVLTTQWYRRLLPTIRSRCIQIRLVSGESKKSEKGASAVSSSLLARLAAFSGEAPLAPEVLQQIVEILETQLRQQGPTPALRAAYLRLKDYYRISSFPGGNQKLARDVLLASLPKT